MPIWGHNGAENWQLSCRLEVIEYVKLLYLWLFTQDRPIGSFSPIDIPMGPFSPINPLTGIHSMMWVYTFLMKKEYVFWAN